MYLSRLTLNPRSAQVRSELARPYEMHRTLLRAFPQGSVGVARDGGDAIGLLFRVDEDPRTQLITVLVQSQLAPDWAYLAAQTDVRGHAYLLPASTLTDGKPNPAVRKFDLSKKISVGQHLTFRLRANPTKRLGKSAKTNIGKRVGLYAEQQQMDWLERKAQDGGFRILRAYASRDEKIKNEDAIKRDEGAKHKLELVTVQFDGVLQVLNKDELCKHITKGIGSSKSFGCGLLSLAPS